MAMIDKLEDISANSEISLERLITQMHPRTHADNVCSVTLLQTCRITRGNIVRSGVIYVEEVKRTPHNS